MSHRLGKPSLHGNPVAAGPAVSGSRQRKLQHFLGVTGPARQADEALYPAHTRRSLLEKRGPKPPEVTNGDGHIRVRLHVDVHVHVASNRHHGHNGRLVRRSSHKRIRKFSSNDHKRCKLTALGRCSRRYRRSLPIQSALPMLIPRKVLRRRVRPILQLRT